MKKKKIIGLTAATLVLGSTIVTANASSQIATRPRASMGVSQEDFQAEKAAIENGDYAAWKSVVEKHGDARILGTINESNFSKYAEAFRLRESGDMEGSNEIMKELGLNGLGKRKSDGMHGVSISKEEEKAIATAIKNSDYGAWKIATASLPDNKIVKSITQENFNVLVEAYKLKENGDMGSAMKLLKSGKIPGGILLGNEKGRNGDEVSGVDPEALMETYINKDYSAWKALMGERGGKILEIINADNFIRFAKAKVLQSDGKDEEARVIFKELGFPFQDRGVRSGKPADALMHTIGPSSDSDPK